ncbi:cell division protein ZapE [Plantibacter sp. Mn2098]|uniref:cell division protein ZapE n=1 Tax=Plantibacter sp. Mn2098 TaxID=3395266 RepID=UPI003BECF671
MTQQDTTTDRTHGDHTSSSDSQPTSTTLHAIETAATAAGFALDPAQRVVAERLAALGDAVIDSTPDRPLPRSLYLWGPAGRGKTWLLDACFDALPTTAKKRVHFHSFFRALHLAIHTHRTAAAEAARAAAPAAATAASSTPPAPTAPSATTTTAFVSARAAATAVTNAVDAAVDELLDGASVVYFDELHVHDPGDATLITKLLLALFDRDVTLIASSNYAPGDLLPDPVYHHIFEPGIALIEANMDIVRLDGDVDHRHAEPSVAREGFARGSWISPGSGAQLASLGLDRPTEDERTDLPISGHVFTALAVRGDTVWFACADLLEAKTSVGDYLAWAASFDRWILDDVPSPTELTREARMRFVHLVDALCDLGKELHVIAAGPRDEFVNAPVFARDFFRTASRLAMLRTDV